MSLLLLLYGTGEESTTPAPPFTPPTEEHLTLGGVYLAAPRRRKPRDRNLEALRNLANFFIKDDEELVLMSVMMD